MKCTRVTSFSVKPFQPTPQRKITIQSPNWHSTQLKQVKVQGSLKNARIGLSTARGISFSKPLRDQISSLKTDQTPHQAPITDKEEINSFDQQAQYLLLQIPPRTLEVSNLIERSLDNGITPPITKETFESLVYKLAIQKHTQTIQTLISKLEKINSQLLAPISYACVVVSLVLGGRYESGQQLYEDYITQKNIKFDTESSNLLIKMFGMRSQLGSAVQVFKAMKKNGIQPNVDTFNNLTYIFSRKGSASKVTECVEKMKAAGIQPNHETFNHLITHYAIRKNFSQAIKYLRDYIQYDSEQQKRVSSDVVGAFNTILLVHARNGDTTEMIKVYEEIQKQGYAPNRATITIVLMHFLNKKELKPAINYYYVMKGYGYPTFDMVQHFYRSFKREATVPTETLELWKSMLPNKKSLVKVSIESEDLKKFEDSLDALQH